MNVTYCKSENELLASGGFNPEALERGAKALREINSSPHAKKVLELTRQQVSVLSYSVLCTKFIIQ